MHRNVCSSGKLAYLLISHLVCVSGAGPRQVRFTFTETRHSAPEIQLSEIHLFDASQQRLNVMSATNPGGFNTDDAREGSLKLIDDDMSTKWLDKGFQPIGRQPSIVLTLEQGQSPLASYQFIIV